jgi:hypothetical protein
MTPGAVDPGDRSIPNERGKPLNGNPRTETDLQDVVAGLHVEQRDGEGIALPTLDSHHGPRQPTERAARMRELRCRGTHGS